MKAWSLLGVASWMHSLKLVCDLAGEEEREGGREEEGEGGEERERNERGREDKLGTKRITY